MTADGTLLFARYAYAPNHLGFCGPAETATLFDLGVTGHTEADVAAIARRFSGAWPYAAVLAEVAGIADPLDERVMRAYWTGGPLLETVDRQAFGSRLLDVLGAKAGRYWAHLTPELLPEVTPTHGFHVLGVYPWSRLLADKGFEQPLDVLQNCRIRWGRVVAVEDEHVRVESRKLTWDGRRLALADPGEERVRFAVAGRGFVPQPAVGERLALHWDWACDRLNGAEVDYLQRCTEHQLDLTNARLAHRPEES